MEDNQEFRNKPVHSQPTVFGGEFQDNSMRERTIFQQMVVGQLDAKGCIWTLSSYYTQHLTHNGSKPKCENKNIKLLEEIIGVNLVTLVRQ